jgi:hypothetical protein
VVTVVSSHAKSLSLSRRMGHQIGYQLPHLFLSGHETKIQLRISDLNKSGKDI